MLPVQVSEDFLARLFQSIDENPKSKVTIDLPNQIIINQRTDEHETFEISAYKKHCLENGLDDIDFLLSHQDKIEKWERKYA